MKSTDKPTIKPAAVLREEFDDGTMLFCSIDNSSAGTANWKLLNGRCIPKQVTTEAAGQREDTPAPESTLWRRKSFTLSLADSTRLIIRPGDEMAGRVVTSLARAARLSPVSSSPPPGTRCLWVVTACNDSLNRPAAQVPAINQNDIICLLEPPGTAQLFKLWRLANPAPEPLSPEQWFWRQLMRLSACIAGETFPRGGVLLHSGLVLLPSSLGSGTENEGILLAGRSGVGKSTASRRLPPSWRALADDLTLVVREEKGTYWAHPWPTWSRFFGEEQGNGSDTWDVQCAVLLRAIFVLEQGGEDRVVQQGPGHTVALLAELARQTSTQYLYGWPLEKIAVFNRQRFESLCALVQAVPAYLLHVSRHGAFWEEIAFAIQ